MAQPKIIKKTVKGVFSEKGISLIILTITMLAMTMILASRNFMFENIIENGISKKDIYATKAIRIVDVDQTEQRKKQLAKRVDPILKPAQDTHVRNNLKSLFASVKTIKVSDASYANKKQKLKVLFGVNDKKVQDDKQINYLLKITDESLDKLSDEASKTLGRVLDKGISEADLSGNIDVSITISADSSLSSTQKDTITFMIKQILAPNMVVDELATDIARKNAMNSVKPIYVTYTEGQKIVSSQEIVSKLQKDALREAGYNISELNLSGLFGIFCFVGLSFFLLAYYLINFDSKYLTIPYLSLLSLLAVSVSFCAVILPVNVPAYIIPFPAVAILLTIFINPRIALLFTMLLITMISVSLQYRVDTIAVFIIGMSIAIFTASLINFSRRMDLIRTGFDISLAQVLAVISIYLLQNNFYEINSNMLILDISLAFISGLISGIIALGVIPLIESSFKIITPYGLAELADHNQPLLRRLQFEAPGTYHHSLMVSNLAEAAAEAVNADPVLVRVGAFYHDVGKLKRPLFFVENQSYFGIENPHQNLNPRLSKMVITAHPKDGVELVKEYGLPPIVNQFILQHHGNGLTTYFYKQAINEEGAENITEEQFRYNGPKPSSKEAAILMIADAVESAVRSLKNPSQEQIEELISKLIQERLLDGQLEESPLTQKDLNTIAATFNRILRGMQHHRIKYHENIIEELENKTAKKIQISYTTQKIDEEKELGEKLKKANKDDNSK
ncbi:MAG: HDIG domain-containing protein [Candidatus Gastranaerophilales bacterium]|nr:HDIG domain-containing protein [Candidatus Gastranaerophilales bacterium]